MINEERLQKIPQEKVNEWKLKLTHGDYQKMATKFDSFASKYSDAIKTGFATPTTIKELTKFFASKKQTV